MGEKKKEKKTFLNPNGNEIQSSSTRR